MSVPDECEPMELVHRLRDALTWSDGPGRQYSVRVSNATVADAASTIERLQRELDEARGGSRVALTANLDRAEGSLAMIDAGLARGLPFGYDPATGFLHANDGGAPSSCVFYVPQSELDAAEASLAKAEARVKELEAVGRALLDRYIALVNSGDCGFWSADDEPPVIGMRSALAAISAIKEPRP